MEKKKGNMVSYKKKKETIKKKTRELSILCDIKACAILVGPDGEVDTWPENPTDFNPIIQSYKRNLFHGKRKVIDDGYLKKKSKKNHALFCDDQYRESKESLLLKLNSKLEAVEKRIEFLKMVNNGHCVIGDVAGSTSSGKDADQETHNSDFDLWGSNVAAINGDQLTTSREKEVVGANQEKCNSDSEFCGSVEINGDAMAAEFWGSFGTLVNQQRLANDSFMAFKPNYDYPIPFSTGSF